LAGLRGSNKTPLPLCAQLFPVHPRYPNKWIDDANNAGNDPGSRVRIHTEKAGSLPHMLLNLLDRRLWLAEKLEMEDKPLSSPTGAKLDDVSAFLQSESMDRRIAALLPGLSLCQFPEDDEKTAGNGFVPAAFGLLKLCFTRDSILQTLGVLAPDKHLPVPTGILAQLASGHKPERAMLTAWRRLHASGLNPIFSPDALPSLGGLSPQRVAAALLIPLRYGAYGRLAQSVLKASDSAGNPAA
jgi:CRISPR-associated protein Csx17